MQALHLFRRAPTNTNHVTTVCSCQAGIVPMTDALRNELLEVVTGMAKRGLRCICLTYTDYALEDPNRPASE